MDKHTLAYHIEEASQHLRLAKIQDQCYDKIAHILRAEAHIEDLESEMLKWVNKKLSIKDYKIS